MNKDNGGHLARYAISEANLIKFVDDLWDRWENSSARTREELHSDSRVAAYELREFTDLGWPVLEDAIRLRSPVKSNWAGATYYFDRATGIAYHWAGYW